MKRLKSIVTSFLQVDGIEMCRREQIYCVFMWAIRRATWTASYTRPRLYVFSFKIFMNLITFVDLEHHTASEITTHSANDWWLNLRMGAYSHRKWWEVSFVFWQDVHKAISEIPILRVVRDSLLLNGLKPLVLFLFTLSKTRSIQQKDWKRSFLI